MQNSIEEELARIDKVEFDRKTYGAKINLIEALVKSQKYSNKVECLQHLAKTIAKLEGSPDQLIKDCSGLRASFQADPENQELLTWFLNCLIGYQTRLLLLNGKSSRLITYFETLVKLGLTEDRIHFLFEQLPLVLTEDERELYANLTWREFYKIPSALLREQEKTCPF